MVAGRPPGAQELLDFRKGGDVPRACPSAFGSPGGPAPPPQTCREPGTDPAPAGQRHGAVRWGAARPRGGHGGGREMGWGRCRAAAPAAEPCHPCAAASPEALPGAGRSPVHGPGGHRQLKQVHVLNRALLRPYWFQSAPRGSSPASAPAASASCGGSPLPAGRTPRDGRDCPRPCPRRSSGSQRDLDVHHKRLKAQ